MTSGPHDSGSGELWTQHMTGEEVNSTERGFGTVADILPTLQQHGFDVKDFFSNLGIDGDVSRVVRQRVGTGLFRVVEGESLATDMEVAVPGNLVDHKAALQGIDVVKVHFNLINSFENVFSKTKSPEEIKTLVWLWELGRYAGLQLHRQVVFKQYPIGFPRNFKGAEFWKQLSTDLFPDRQLPDQITDEAFIDHFSIALPERIASTVASCMLIHSGQATADQLKHLNSNLRLRALRPVRNAQEFGITSGTTSLYEFGSVSPLNLSDFLEYLEYVKDTTNLEFLRDGAKK